MFLCRVGRNPKRIFDSRTVWPSRRKAESFSLQATTWIGLFYGTMWIESGKFYSRASSSRFDLCYGLKAEFFDAYFSHFELLNFAGNGNRKAIHKLPIMGDFEIRETGFAKSF